MVLVGMSLGGYLASRAAAGRRRSSLGAMKTVSLCIRLRGPKTFCFIYRDIEPNSIIHRGDPIRANIFVLVPGALIGSKDLQMSSFDPVDGSDVRAVAVYDGHTLDHQIEQRSSFSSVIRMLCHCLLRPKKPQ
jgi:hypothetical protein